MTTKSDSQDKRTAIEIAFGKIQGVVEEFKNDEKFKEVASATQEELVREDNNFDEGIDDEAPQVIVQEGNEDEDEEHINVLNKDRSYMLSYIISK